MKTRHSSRRNKKGKLAVALMAAAVVAVIWSAVPAAANPPYVYPGPSVFPIAGPVLPGPTNVPGKEFSSHSDRDMFHVGDPEQVLNWDGVGGTYDGVDYSGSRIGSDPEDTTDGQVDALANHLDALYHEVIGNVSHLLFSVDADPNVYYERWGPGPPVGGVWADQSISQPDGAPGSDIDVDAAGGFGILDLDGLEVWGPEPGSITGGPPVIGDANRYSLGAGMPSDPLGVSVWDVSGGIPAVALWLQGEIAVAVSIASGVPIGGGPGQFDPQQINLDGMMTFSSEDPTGLPVDEIMFTIDPMTDASGAPLFDGGEIFVASRVGGVGGAIAAGFLFHGGHLWDTPFPVALTFGLDNENVNALEAVSTVPEPASVVLAGLALVGLMGFRRRGRNG